MKRKWQRFRDKVRACKAVSTKKSVNKKILSDSLKSSDKTFVETFKEEIVH